MECVHRITGTLSPVSTLQGFFQPVHSLSGILNRVVDHVQPIDDYTGEYEATPTRETQIFSTLGLRMTDDFIVLPIPENYGLIEWDGSAMTVS